MAKLYELTNNYNNLLDLINNEEVPKELIEKALSEVDEEIDVKAENIAKVIKSLEVDVNGYKEEEKRLSIQRKYLENKVSNLKEYLDSTMKALGKVKIKGKVFTLAIQKNPPSVEILNSKAIDNKYLISQEPTIDKKAILEDLKNNIDVKGAAIKQTESLRIR